MAKKEITIVREIAAPREKVWQAWTDASQLKEWWAPRGFTNPIAEVDARAGRQLRVVMQAGEGLGAMSGMKAPMRGTFTEVVENEKLVFTTEALDESEQDVLLSGETCVLFEDLGGKTKLTITASAEGDAPGTDMMLAGMEQGWNEQTDKLVERLSN